MNTKENCNIYTIRLSEEKKNRAKGLWNYTYNMYERRCY